jgi:cytochrome c peroxidase
MSPPRLGWVKPLLAACLVGVALAAWTGPPVGGAAAATLDSVLHWVLPPGFPEPAVPPDNPMSVAKVDLGRHLFYDPRLSGNGSLACAGCHLQEKAFTDGLALAVGSTGEHTARSSQQLGNVAYSPTLTWANPSLLTLERQMEVPLFGEDPVEMGVNDHNKAQVLQRFKDDALYRQKFAAAFAPGDAAFSWSNIIKAIASFQRTLLTGNSRYDQFMAGKAALTLPERRGMDLFFGEKAECHHCHGSFNFNDQVLDVSNRVLEKPFHNTGLYNIDGQGGFPEPNRGVFELSGLPQDMGLFRAPSLRNVAVTAPYMHDGSITTLEAVLDFYADGGRHIPSGAHQGDGRLSPNKSDLITFIDLNAQDKADIVAFLKTLTDTEFLNNPKLSDPFKTR